MAGYWIIAPSFPMIEPVPAPEIFVDCLAGIWYDSSGTIMLPLYRKEVTVEAPRMPPQQVLKARIIMPIVSAPEAIGMLARVLWRRPPHEQPMDDIPTKTPPDRRVYAVK